ncbi:MAG: DUF1049 domain-containing protein [Bacteroidales bacterium]|nr:DUF1049 domain-containing protein [Bacteroidales bacterium]
MTKISDKINLTPGMIIDIILIAIMLIFIGQNLQAARVRFLVFGFNLPLIIIIAISFIIGYFTAKAFSKKNKKEECPENQPEKTE